MKKMKRIIAMVLLCVITSACADNKQEELTQSLESEQQIEEAYANMPHLAPGISLGCALDSYDGKKYDTDAIIQKRDKYQVMASYATKEYSAWDASGTPFFGTEEENVCFLEWQIDSLNSSNTRCGIFGIQLINHSVGDTVEGVLRYEISEAEFITKSGIHIALDTLNGTYESKIKDAVADWIRCDLSKVNQLKVTSDLIGGKLKLKIEITEYPSPINYNIPSETVYYETLFGNNQITKENIEFLKESGFQTVRIPVTYYDHISKDGTVNKEWLNRVEEVVRYVIDQDMYCIINVHHDTGNNGWIVADENNYRNNEKKVSYLWKQIAERFADYDDKLIFEGFNEILNKERAWNNAGKETYDVANRYNQLFVDTVRSTGENNSKRYLIVNTYAASAEEDVNKEFVIPNDVMKNRLIVSVHCYFGGDRIEEVFERLNRYYVSQGIPVMVGEFGRQNQDADRVTYVEKYLQEAEKYNIPCIWWDDGGKYNSAEEIKNYALFDRNQNKWYFEDIKKILLHYS